MGVLPPWWRPYVKRFIPWFSKGDQAVKNLAGLAIAAVSKRLNQPTYRVDLLSKLQEGKDDEGRPMGREELTAEALTQLIAGSDTTSKYELNPLSLWRQEEDTHPYIGSRVVRQHFLCHHLLPCYQSNCSSQTACRTRCRSWK